MIQLKKNIYSQRMRKMERYNQIDKVLMMMMKKKGGNPISIITYIYIYIYNKYSIENSLAKVLVFIIPLCSPVI